MSGAGSLTVPLVAGLLDSGWSDTGLLDSGLLDSGWSDTELLVAGLLDSGWSDTELLVAGLLDSGLSPTESLADSGSLCSAVAAAAGPVASAPLAGSVSSKRLRSGIVLALRIGSELR
ncbi:hypothetical protein ACX80T_10680 [Arthrobacter sp. Sr33]